MEKSELLGTLARGYCTPENSHKIVDPDLVTAMADEMIKEINEYVDSVRYADPVNKSSPDHVPQDYDGEPFQLLFV